MTIWDLITAALDAFRELARGGEVAASDHLSERAIDGLREGLTRLPVASDGAALSLGDFGEPRVGPSDRGVAIMVEFDAGGERLLLVAFADAADHIDDCVVTRAEDSPAR